MFVHKVFMHFEWYSS